ncbi:MAG: hypothetical protein ACOC56_06465 [Atribacterota bacterium]
MSVDKKKIAKISYNGKKSKNTDLNSTDRSKNKLVFKNKENYDMSEALIDIPDEIARANISAFIGCDSNYFNYAKALIASIHIKEPSWKIYFYGINLTKQQKNEIKNLKTLKDHIFESKEFNNNKQRILYAQTNRFYALSGLMHKYKNDNEIILFLDADAILQNKVSSRVKNRLAQCDICMNYRNTKDEGRKYLAGVILIKNNKKTRTLFNDVVTLISSSRLFDYMDQYCIYKAIEKNKTNLSFLAGNDLYLMTRSNSFNDENKKAFFFCFRPTLRRQKVLSDKMKYLIKYYHSNLI